MKRQILSTFATLSLSLALIFGTVSPAAAASAEKSSQTQSTETQPTVETGTVTPVSSNNINRQNYTGYLESWSRPVTSYLYENKNGGFTRVECYSQSIETKEETEEEYYEVFVLYRPDNFYEDGSDDLVADEHHVLKVTIEDYDSAFQIQSAKEIDMELPIWGGFFAGEDYNFLVFGQKNENDNDNQEVIRVVKYSKDWQRIGSASLYGANTTIPFYAGNLRMTQSGNILYIRTSHEMYSGHQANLTFSVRISDMTITDQFSEVMNIDSGYVSHSFNQFITTDGSTLLAADHGDAYPRSVSLIKYKKEAGSDTFTYPYDYDYCDYVDVFPIQGSTGVNETGVSVGSLAISDSSYLIAGTSVPQDDTYNAFGTRNIFVTSTPKNQFDAEHTKIHWITNYKQSDKVSISNPHMVKISNQKFLLLYTIDGKINYTYLDGAGNQTSDIYTMEGKLSDCQPILYQDKIIWYYTNNSIPSFCSISLNSANGQKTGWQFTNNHWYYFDPANGTMKTDWQLINNKWYYFDPASGVMKTDWQFINNQWYYFDLTNGDMKTGWLKWNNQWYYLDLNNGNCLTNTTTPDGYTVDENGILIQ